MSLWASSLHLWFKGSPAGVPILPTTLTPSMDSSDTYFCTSTMCQASFCAGHTTDRTQTNTCPLWATFTEERQTVNKMNKKNAVY